MTTVEKVGGDLIRLVPTISEVGGTRPTSLLGGCTYDFCATDSRGKSLLSQARSQKLNKEKAIPSPSFIPYFSLPLPPFLLEVGPLPRLRLGAWGSAQAPQRVWAEPAAAKAYLGSRKRV